MVCASCRSRKNGRRSLPAPLSSSPSTWTSFAAASADCRARGRSSESSGGLGGADERVVAVGVGDLGIDESDAPQEGVDLGGGELFASGAEHHHRKERRG